MNINANINTQLGSGVVVSGVPHVITFPIQTKIVSFAVKPSSGNIMNIKYNLDENADVILWIEWTYGEVNDTQVWSAAFNGGFRQFEVSGDGNYSYSWD
jgi:hypothetical protein